MTAVAVADTRGHGAVTTGSGLSRGRLVPLWIAITAAFGGLFAGAAAVQAAYMYALRSSDGQHSDTRAAYSPAETADRIRRRDSAAFQPPSSHRTNGPSCIGMADEPTEPIGIAAGALRWPLQITYAGGRHAMWENGSGH